MAGRKPGRVSRPSRKARWEREAAEFADVMADGYERVYHELVAILYRLDPLGVCQPGGAPANEYSPEARTILPRLRHAQASDKVRHIMQEEFDHWFGGSWSASPTRLQGAAEEIWKLWTDEQQRRGQVGS